MIYSNINVFQISFAPLPSVYQVHETAAKSKDRIQDADSAATAGGKDWYTKGDEYGVVKRLDFKMGLLG